MNASPKIINAKTVEGCEKCGEWRLLREIGRGAYGVVYLAEASGGRRAALKLCRRASTEEERYARELRGAKLYMSVSASEGLVGMREVVEEDWGFYSVMDLADDEFDRADASSESYRPKTLTKVIEGEKALPLKECVKLGIALAKGLAALQRRHLLHRDIKPGNVIYIGGKPVLSDPGLLVEESEASSLVGTPGYVPPEKFAGAGSDIYSLGLTLKAASFGRRVEDLDKGPAQEADTGARFFPAWWRILNKATDPDTSRRYRSAKALLKDLLFLRRKIAIASFAKSRTAKTVYALAALCIAAVAVASIIAIKQIKNAANQANENTIQAKNGIVKQSAEIAEAKKTVSAFDAMAEESIRETLKGILPKDRIEDEVLRIKSHGRYSNWGGLKIKAENRGAIEWYMDNFERKIEEIGTIDKAKAEQLQRSYDNLAEKIAGLDAKDASLKKEIILLHSKGKEKVLSGFDDKEEFEKARKIFEKRNSLFVEIYPQVEEFSHIVWRIHRDCGLDPWLLR